MGKEILPWIVFCSTLVFLSGFHTLLFTKEDENTNCGLKLSGVPQYSRGMGRRCALAKLYEKSAVPYQISHGAIPCRGYCGLNLKTQRRFAVRQFSRWASPPNSPARNNGCRGLELWTARASIPLSRAQHHCSSLLETLNISCIWEMNVFIGDENGTAKPQRDSRKIITPFLLWAPTLGIVTAIAAKLVVYNG